MPSGVGGGDGGDGADCHPPMLIYAGPRPSGEGLRGMVAVPLDFDLEAQGREKHFVW